MTVSDLDTITPMYPDHTGVGGDGAHPKVGNQLSVGAKQVIVDGLNKCEELEAWPGVLNILNAAPKETGGYRLLGLFSTRYRWWSRVRFLHAAEWEKEFNHRVFWSGRGDPVLVQFWSIFLKMNSLGQRGSMGLVSLQTCGRPMR